MQYCWSLGGYLAEFSTLEEEQSVQSLLNQDIIYWIGLTDFAMEGTWRWQESHQEPSYTNWASGQPDNGVDEDCVTISGDNSFYPWHDAMCYVLRTILFHGNIQYMHYVKEAIQKQQHQDQQHQPIL